jgi:hypothetical protein
LLFFRSSETHHNIFIIKLFFKITILTLQIIVTFIVILCKFCLLWVSGQLMPCQYVIARLFPAACPGVRSLVVGCLWVQTVKFSVRLSLAKIDFIGLILHTGAYVSCLQTGLDDNITTVSSQRDQNIITQIIITKFNITWNIITK